jgi:hypothetical protein
VLELLNAEGAISKKYVILSQEKSKVFFLTVKLPDEISCSHCVLQWTYVAGKGFTLSTEVLYVYVR